MKKPLVSVCMITYNHAKFIAQAIEGVLKQETDFDFELIIGEDFSTDGTRKICVAYQKQFPGKIKLLEREKNLGMQPNFSDSLSNCAGHYIALCEGDDYWTDSLKLQKQVDFLEANSEFSICFHSVERAYEDGSKPNEVTNRDTKEITTFEDLALDNFIYTASCVFRNNLVTFPEWFDKVVAGDYPLHLLNAAHGKIAFIDEVMAVYRIHIGGVWSMRDRKNAHIQWALLVEQCRQHFSPRGAAQFSRQLAKLYAILSVMHYTDAQYKDFQHYYRSLIRFVRYYDNKRQFLALTIRYLISYEPRLATYYNSFRNWKINTF